MALDLFANFERASNSSLFYRIVSADPFTVSIKLSDLATPDEELGTLYYAESSVNGGPYSEFFAGIDGSFIMNMQLDRTVASISSISVSVSSNGSLAAEYTLSAVFLDEIPVAEFIAYPSSVIFLSGGAIPSKLDLTSSNYYQTSGVAFYGEGHTEIINLSSSLSDVSLSAFWYVGNELTEIVDLGTSNISVTSSGSTAFTQITSEPNQQTEYSISLFVASTAIPNPSNLITYNDSTGLQEYYPFFTSTLISEETSKLKEPIRVLTYPEPGAVTLQSPFPNQPFSLPFDYSTETFLAILHDSIPSTVLTETYKGSEWYVEGSTINQAWETAGTGFLPNILAYQFNIGYDNDPNDEGSYLSLFKASASTNTTLVLKASAVKDAKINLAPFDWQTKTYTQSFEVSSTAVPIPFAKIYLEHFYHIKNEPVQLTLLPSPNPDYNLISVTVQSENSPNILDLTSSLLSGTMTFDKIGLANLSATAVIKNVNTDSNQQISVLFPEMLEIVETYDEVEEEYYQTALTPIVLSYNEAPKISPNEWAIANNVNSVLEKLYTVVEDLNDYTKLYEPKNKFYGWLGPIQRGSTINEGSIIYVWQDLECPPAPENQSTWADFEVIGDGEVCSTGQSSWLYHECEEDQSDPTCLGKHCVEWKWRSRKCNVSETKITWKDAKCNGIYDKRWKFEKCETDSETLNCSRDSWKISTIDPEFFPIPSCMSTSRCNIVDVAPTKDSRLVIAYQTELNLVNTNYQSTFVTRRGIADELFAFQNIVGIASGTEGRIFVLDGTLSRVSVFLIKDDSFRLFTAWGDYGLVSSPQGFNSPTDIHVDSENSLWIADKGNECVKKLTITGRNLMTITSEYFEENPPISTCIDSKKNLHCLTKKGIFVFDSRGQFSFKYDLPADVTNVSKINTSFNREMVYITYDLGVVKYFRTGVIAEYLFNEYKCASGQILNGYRSTAQDKFRNVYITVGDKVLKVPDLMDNVESKAALSPTLYWKLSDILVHKEEYIQPWVYLKSFHRLWDNIELFRTSLFYSETGCKSYRAPVYSKNDLVIGQNEIVTNAVINRLSNQLWTNLELLFDYFDPTCSENG